jgi:hypothetical protein
MIVLSAFDLALEPPRGNYVVSPYRVWLAQIPVSLTLALVYPPPT